MSPGDRRLADLAAFLRTRRERLTPEQAGLTLRHGPRGRRAPGLRREGIAELAGMSVAWYTHLEQGRDVRPSAASLRRLAEALRLNDDERAYLLTLATDVVAPEQLPPGRPVFTPDLARLLDGLHPNPAFLMDRAWDVVGRNAAIEALIPSLVSVPVAENNALRFAFTPGWRAAVADWEAHARLAVAGFRMSAARAPDDPRFAALVAELRAASPEFRALWDEHDVWRGGRALTQRYEYPHVGAIEVAVTLLDLREPEGLTLAVYMPCDAESAARLRRLVRTAPALP